MIEKQNSDNKYEVDELSIGCLVKMELVRPVRFPSDHRDKADLQTYRSLPTLSSSETCWLYSTINPTLSLLAR